MNPQTDNNLNILNALVPIDEQPFEVVERKGLGHPDTLADGIAESISIEYSGYCLEHFGAVLHHNVDKVLIMGGLCDVDFGIAKMKEPIRLVLNGRMSKQFGDAKIDIQKFQTTIAKKYLSERLPHLDIERWVRVKPEVTSSTRIPYWFSPRSLADVPDATNPHANDTATIVGFYPLSTVERLVLIIEKFFYNERVAPRFEFIGHDIKIMALRRGADIELTLCVPFFAKLIKNNEEYLEKLGEIRNGLEELIQTELKGRFNCVLNMNTQDQRVKDRTHAKGLYFVASGSALDFGEEGVTGRGNRSRGLISSMRPSTVESIFGKNSVYHVGKVYAYFANKLSKAIAEQFDCETTVIINSRNGDPLYSPRSIAVNATKKLDKAEISALIKQELEEQSWTRDIVMKGIYLPTNDFLNV